MFGSHSFPCRSLPLGTNVPNDINIYCILIGNERTVDRLIPEYFQKFYQETIKRIITIYREGNIFPILEYQDLE